MHTTNYIQIADCLIAQLQGYSRDSDTDRIKYFTVWESLQRLADTFEDTDTNFKKGLFFAYCEKKLGIATTRAAALKI